jgi:hypothetical protein
VSKVCTEHCRTVGAALCRRGWLGYAPTASR